MVDPEVLERIAARRAELDGLEEQLIKLMDQVRAAQAKADAAGDVDWLMSVDSAVVRAHQHAAGARKGAPRPGPRSVPRRSDQQDPPRL
ncbi:hypothetical protein [Streptomyces sp. SR27]|uniref:hypothetical protein n=1 Tax=Streptomyces sp. SR27 TaxID=3076630 RepID=UPI003FA3C236